eukprot:NODE_390_length_8164_cov_0.195908.p3 type:complete len:267 gc:universal NODE_390_length_8164_cov_0.195908:2160-1360(-)
MIVVRHAIPKVHQITFDWNILPYFEVPVSVFVIETENHNILVDCAHRSKKDELLKALDDLGLDLHYLVITHGHIDHAGNLDLILQKYPKLKLVCHPPESDFILPTTTIGNGDKIQPSKLYKDEHGDSFIFNFCAKRGLLEELEFPLFSYTNSIVQIKNGNEIQGIKLIHTPGHTHGHISIHVGNIILAGDVVANIFSIQLSLVKNCLSPHISTAPPASTINMKQCKQSIKELAKYAQENNVDMIYPSHDNGNGITTQQLLDFANKL